MGTKGIATASCSKCSVKHVRPTRVRCKRVLNSSAPVMRDTPSSDQGADTQLTSQSDAHDQAAASALSGAGATAPHLSQIESKVDLILKKMQ